MASNRHSSAMIALLFCVLLALAELHECRRASALEPQKGVILVHNGVNESVWNSNQRVMTLHIIVSHLYEHQSMIQ
jgi:hypothetical protein